MKYVVGAIISAITFALLAMITTVSLTLITTECVVPHLKNYFNLYIPLPVSFAAGIVLVTLVFLCAKK